jgi:hypothetical protein
MRLTTRSHELISSGGAARGPLRATVAVASAAADVALARHLARSDRPELALHGAVDAADLAAWTALATAPGYSQLTTAMNTSHPLAIEAGARHGLAGVLVPVAGCLLSGAVMRARRVPHVPSAFVWQVGAALGGAGLARYARRLRTRRLEAHEQRLAPELARAELAAKSEVALGLDNVVDEVQRAAVLVRLGASVPADGGGGWKVELAEQTRRSHRYLVDVLVGWQHRHNQTPDLTRVVNLDISPLLAPVVLSAGAAASLEATLDRLALRGRTRVAPPDGAGPVPTEPTVSLQVGDHRLDIETGAVPVRLDVDTLPGGFAWLALWLAAAGPRDAVPPAAALGPAAVALGFMRWAHGRARVGEHVSRDRAVQLSTALAAAATVVQTRTMRRPHNALGNPSVPASLALRGHAFVTALARPELSRRALTLSWLGGAATVVAGWALTPRPRPLREFVAEMTWVAMSATMARAFTEGIERDSADLEAWVATEDRRRLAASAAAGRRAAVEAARAALRDVELLFARHADALEEALRSEARRRIDACSGRLATMV